MVMGFQLSHNSRLELMQNCDLPPPVKVFAGSNKAVLFPISEKYHKQVHAQVNDQEDEKINKVGEDLEKLELLKALRLSQTRAREAEKKAAILSKERESLSKAYVNDASKLFAYRQWVRLFELELLKLRREEQESRICSVCDGLNGMRWLSDNEGDGGNEGNFTWFMALALCFGIAGVGFAFGCRYLI